LEKDWTRTKKRKIVVSSNAPAVAGDRTTQPGVTTTATVSGMTGDKILIAKRRDVRQAPEMDLES
jgi:hypothetical protein